MVLGYRFTGDLDVVNERGAHLYHMIFATDHDAGTRTALYSKAAGDFPQMRRQARERRRVQEEQAQGILRLPGMDDPMLSPPRGLGEVGVIGMIVRIIDPRTPRWGPSEAAPTRPPLHWL
jgi:hypothetical protein